MKDHVIKGHKRRGIIAIDDFDIIRMKCNLNGVVSYSLIKNNIADLGIQDIVPGLEAIIEEFKSSFR